MPSSTHRSPAAPTGLEWLDCWTKSCEILWTAPAVIAYRTSRMMLGGWPPSARDRREYARMGQEKVDALAESLMAATLAWPNASVGVLAQTITPFHRRVTANHRRLAKG